MRSFDASRLPRWFVLGLHRFYRLLLAADSEARLPLAEYPRVTPSPSYQGDAGQKSK